jgi:AraC family transcriptional regulator of arabinose operon
VTRRMLTFHDTPSRGLMATGLWVNICGHHQGGPAYQLVKGVQVDYLLILTIGGDGWFRLRQRYYAVGPGDALLVPPNPDHGYGTGPSGLWDILWVHMDGPTIPQLLAFWPDYPDVPCVHVTRPEEMTHLLTRLLCEMAERRDGYSVLAAGDAQQALRLVIVDAWRGHTSRASTQAQALVQTVEEYVQQHLDVPLTLAQMAAYAHVSPAHLCRTFKKATGFSPLEYSIKQRHNRAKELLQTTALPVAAVARQVGYNDAAYFARVFRATTGLTPTAFRRLEIGRAGDETGP